MTTTPTAIITYLDTNWDTGVIAKPVFVNQFENEAIREPRSLGVNWAGIEWIAMTSGFGSKDEESNTITLQVVEDSLANLLLSFKHTRDLLKVKTLAGGHYMVTSANPMKVGRHYMCFLTLEEVIALQ